MTEIDTAKTMSKKQSSSKSGVFIWWFPSIVASAVVVGLFLYKKGDPGFNPELIALIKPGRLALGFILSVLAAFIGTQIGDLLRKIAMPTFVMGSGMVDMLKQKLFWAVGPQFIGLGIGQGVIWYWLFS